MPRPERAVNLTPFRKADYPLSTMPTYEFRCTKCQSLFNARMSVSEHGRDLPACPKCGSRAVEQVLSAFFAKTVRKS